MTEPTEQFAAIKYSVTDATINKLIEKNSVVINANGKDGYKSVTTAIREFRELRLGIEEFHKTHKAPILEAGRYLDKEKKRLIEMIAPEEVRLKIIKTAVDNAKEIERKAKEAVEAQRIDAIKERIQLMEVSIDVINSPLAEIEETFEYLSHVVIDEEYMELIKYAHDVKDKSLAMLLSLIETKKADIEKQNAIATENKRLQKQRDELKEKQDAFEKERAEQEAKAAAERAEHERKLANEYAERERLAAVEDAKRQALADEAQAKLQAATDVHNAKAEAQQEQMRKQQEEIDKQNAMVQKKQDEADKRLREEKEAAYQAQADRQKEELRLASEASKAKAKKIADEKAKVEAERKEQERKDALPDLEKINDYALRIQSGLLHVDTQKINDCLQCVHAAYIVSLNDIIKKGS